MKEQLQGSKFNRNLGLTEQSNVARVSVRSHSFL